MSVQIHPKIKEFLSSFYLALEWRVIATFLTFVASYIVSKSIKISVAIVGVEVILKVIIQAFWIRFRVKNKE